MSNRSKIILILLYTFVLKYTTLIIYYKQEMLEWHIPPPPHSLWGALLSQTIKKLQIIVQFLRTFYCFYVQNVQFHYCLCCDDSPRRPTGFTSQVCASWKFSLLLWVTPEGRRIFFLSHVFNYSEVPIVNITRWQQ